MSAIVGVFGTGRAGRQEGVADRMLRVMRARGAERLEVWNEDDVTLGVSRHEWESSDGFSGPALVVAEHDLAVVADASLYYRDDLRRALQACGVMAGSATPSHLVLAAYRAWGEECVDHLEGDFAFIVWDRARRRVLCARDFAGRRNLCYAEVGGALIVASSVPGVLAHPACPSDLNLAAVAEAAAGLVAASHDSCYSAVSTLPAGWSLTRSDSGDVKTVRHWEFPEIDTGRCPSFEDAAEELQSLLGRSVSERLAPEGPTSIWLSGGYDSTAIFGIGSNLLRSRSESQRLMPVSMSYPPGDRGREDETITDVTRFWNAPVHWVDIKNVGMLEDAEERAASWDEPFLHPYEGWNRALMRGTRAVGSRVALQGDGGDQLFAVSDIYLADLLRQGRWLRLAREWRLKDSAGYRAFYSDVVEPALPGRARKVVAAMTGGSAASDYLVRAVPPWMDEGFVARHGIDAREQRNMPKRRRGTLASHEMYYSLSYPIVPKVHAQFFGFGLEEGIEIRSPIYDRRIIEFAAPRPQWERASFREIKRLLRRAVRDLLPMHVLAPRRVRTGVLTGYFDRSTRETYRDTIEGVIRAPVLADLGIVNADILRRSWDQYLRDGGGGAGLRLFITLQVELWLRTHLRLADSNAAPRTLVTGPAAA